MTTKISGSAGIDRVEPTAAGLPLSFRNKIINGKMEIAQNEQRWGTVKSMAFPSALSYGVIDRWAYSGIGSSGTATISQEADAPIGGEFQHSLRWTQTAATTLSWDSYGVISHKIEGYNVRDLIGKTFTVSFRVRSSKTGIHCIAFRNAGVDRSAVFEYTINQANTWETKSVTVAGGLITAGTWDWKNGIGLQLLFVLGCGSGYVTSTVGEWITGNFKCTTNQVNCLDAAGNIFAITGVQLEAGEVATPFEHRPVGLEQSLCKRYYEIVKIQGITGVTFTLNGDTRSDPIRYSVIKRAAPTVSGDNTLFVIAHGNGGDVVNVNIGYVVGSSYSDCFAVTGVTDVAALGGGLGSVVSWGNSSGYKLFASAEL